MNVMALALDLLQQGMEPAEVALLCDLQVQTVVAIRDALGAAREGAGGLCIRPASPNLGALT